MSIQELYSLFLQHPEITTDSRNCPAGSIFFALKGASFDGNAYALNALGLGCAYAVIDNKDYATDPRCILVDDVLTTLQQLAHHHRMALGTPIIGVTGTNGKTTTKELIAAVLSEKYNILYTQGNFNNHIGVPKTLLQLRPEHELAVIEMGANHPGEIKTLVNIVEPDCGIITNVGKAHLEGFGSFEGVIRTKGELYDFLRAHASNNIIRYSDIPQGSVFIHADNEHLIGIADNLNLIKYGTESRSDYTIHGTITECAPFLTFTWQPTHSTSNSQPSSDARAVNSNSQPSSDAPSINTNSQPSSDAQTSAVSTHLIGSYNIYNMLAAATIGLRFGITPEQVNHALSNYIPSNNRSQLTITAHNKLIVDTYNANPTSMMAALVNFRDMAVSPKMAILGDMRELGDVSAEEHQKVVDFLSLYNINNVWLVGEEFAKTNSTFRKFNNVDEVKQEIAQNPPSDQYILIKGSNGVKLFQLPELL